jgi:CBS domain-containing protein
MRAANVSALLLDEIDGIVTERDVAWALAGGLAPTEAISAAATGHAVSCDPSMRVVDAAALMLNGQVRHLVIDHVAGGRAVVSMRDVLAVLLQAADNRVWLTSLSVSISTPTEIWLG